MILFLFLTKLESHIMAVLAITKKYQPLITSIKCMNMRSSQKVFNLKKEYIDLKKAIC